MKKYHEEDEENEVKKEKKNHVKILDKVKSHFKKNEEEQEEEEQETETPKQSKLDRKKLAISVLNKKMGKNMKK